MTKHNTEHFMQGSIINSDFANRLRIAQQTIKYTTGLSDDVLMTDRHMGWLTGLLFGALDRGDFSRFKEGLEKAIYETQQAGAEKAIVHQALQKLVPALADLESRYAFNQQQQPA